MYFYSYNKWGDGKAVEYVMQIDAELQELIGYPQWGKSRDSIRKGYRSIQINHHVIYYRVEDEYDIDIIRVLN